MKEKSPQEKNAAERQVSLITEGLSKAADNKGVWLSKESNIHGFTQREQL